jgi:adenosylhomocysteine nucleosidase
MSDAEAMLAAVTAGNTAEVVRLLGDDPSLASVRGPDGVSVALLARYRFDRPTVDAILAANPSLDVFEAAALGRVDDLASLLAGAPDAVEAYSPDGFTALHLAAFFGSAAAVGLLLDAGARVDAWTRNALANQPLHAAAAGRQVEICRMLLATGADVNARQHGGFGPLHEAAQLGNREMVELFLAAGAEPGLVADDGSTPTDLAARAGHQEVADLLAGSAATARPGPSAASR